MNNSGSTQNFAYHLEETGSGVELSGVELEIEEFALQGFTVLKSVLSDVELEEARRRLDAVLEFQEQETGKARLAEIGEDNLARCPLGQDLFFLELAARPAILQLVQHIIGGKYVILHLQNGIINRPQLRHKQSAWHRDLPYQEFVSSRPLAIGALYCIDRFSTETGCTHVLPHSHRTEKMPSREYIERYERPVEAPAGSVILFDAMLFHRAGANTSNEVRRAVNNVYSVPIIKQQLNLACVLGQQTIADPARRRLLDLDSPIPGSVAEYRARRK